MAEATMESKVSGFLAETMAPEIQDGFMAPVLRRSFPTVLPLMSRINKAHVVMLRRRDIIDAATAASLAGVIGDLEREGPAAFPLDPALEDPYFNYEAEVIRRLGAETGGRMHTARSRNDLKATLDRLRARRCTLAIGGALLELRQALLSQAERYAEVVMPGYTHMQPAQPLTFGFYLLGVAQGLERDQRRLAEGYARLNLSPLGAAAIAGTSFPIDREMTASLLGFDGVALHTQDAIAARDGIVELLSSSALLATTLSRLAQDFYIMTTYEFGTLYLPDSVAITSSIMPQKKNMAALENLKGRAAQLTGALVTALGAYRATPYSHVQDATLDGLRWTWDALEEVALMLPVARLVVEKAEPRRERMYELVRENFSTITDLADGLVREAGLSFRDAHHVAGRVVRLAMQQGLKADEITAGMVGEAAQQTLGRPLQVEGVLLEASLDPARSVESRLGCGGPSRHDIGEIANQQQQQLSKDRAELEARERRIAEADERMERDFAALAAGGSA